MRCPPTWRRARGEPTNATFGFFSMLLTVLRDVKPEYVAVAFDVGETFRHREYAEYKGHRERMPDDLRQQVERIQEVVSAFNIPIFTREGFEADDVLGTLARQGDAQGVNTIIVTGDRDIVQCVTEQTHVLTSGRKFGDTIVYTPQSVQEKYGLAPKQLIELKALIGDKSDNVPGVKGVGEKGATDLLQRYGTVDAIYEHLDEITAKRTREALEAGRADAFLSKHLVTIVTDVPGIELNLPACRVRDYDKEQVAELFRELEFRTLVERLPEAEAKPKPDVKAAPPGVASRAKGAQLGLFAGSEAEAQAASEQTPSPYEAIVTEQQLSTLVDKLRGAALIAFDTETTATDALAAELVGIALAWDEGQSAYVPVGHKPVGQIANLPSDPSDPSDAKQLPLDLVISTLSPLLEDPTTEKTAHNAEYDLTMLTRYGIRVAGPLFDTMIAEWLIDPASRSLGLKALAWQRLGVEMTPITELIGTGKNQTTMDTVAVDAAARYAAADTDYTWRLAPILRQRAGGEIAHPAVQRRRDAAGAGAGGHADGRHCARRAVSCR